MAAFSTASTGGEEPFEEETWADLARDLRQGVGQEWREELEATEYEMHQHRIRSRTLGEVAEMVLHRGDLVTVETADLHLTGEVTGCGRDYLTLTTETLCVDARLDRITLLVTRRPTGGTAAQGVAPTWRARLCELEITGEPVELHCDSLRGPRRGRIRVVSVDHLWLAEPSGVDCYLPIEGVTAVIRPRVSPSA